MTSTFCWLINQVNRWFVLAVATQGVQKIVCILIIIDFFFKNSLSHQKQNPTWENRVMIDFTRVDWPESEIEIKSKIVWHL